MNFADRRNVAEKKGKSGLPLIGLEADILGVSTFVRKGKQVESAAKKSADTVKKFTLDLKGLAKGITKGLLRPFEGAFDVLEGVTGKTGLMDKAASSLTKTLSKLGPAGLAAVAAIAAIAAAIIPGIQKFGELQAKMNEVFTLLPGISQNAMSEMTAQVQQFNNRFGTLSTETVPALYQALSAGVPPNNVFEFLETAQMAAKGGVTSLTTAVDGISSVVNAYGRDIISATQASDLMFTAVRLGKTNFDELSRSLFNVVPTAQASGIAFREVAAATAAITAIGVPTSVATTQIRQALVDLQKPTTQVAQYFEQLSGESFTDFIANGGSLYDALQLIRNEADANGIQLSELFGSVEAVNAVLALTGENASRFADNLMEMDGAAGATQNAFEQMNQGIIPALDRLKSVFNTILEQVGQLVEPIFVPLVNIVSALGRTISAVLRVVQAMVNLFLGPVIKAFQFAAGGTVSLIDAFNGGIEVIANVIQWIANLRDNVYEGIGRSIMNVIQPWVQTFQNLFTIVKIFAERFILAGARMAGEYANALMAGANQYIFPAVIRIARFIADFLVGQSPPPKGPLSAIDKGGANTMSAWIQGFAGASMDPVKKVTEEVAGLMGGVATMSLAQVESSLARVNAFLEPFENRVKLLESRMSALRDVSDSAFRAIDDSQKRLLERLQAGDKSAEQEIRNLDLKREALQGYVDAQQQSVDDAKLQLAYAKLQVGQQKASLELRKKQLTAGQQEVKSAEKIAVSAAKVSKAAPKKSGSSGGLPTGGSIGEGDVPTAEAINPDDVLPEGNFFDEIGASFNEGLGSNLDTLLEFTTNQAELEAELGRISPEAIGENFTSMFDGLTTTITDNFVTPFSDAYDSVIEFFDPNNEESITNRISTFVTNLPSDLGNLVTNLTTNFSNPFDDAVTSVLNFFTPGSDTFIGSAITTWIDGIPMNWTAFGTNLATYFTSPWTAAFDLVRGFFNSESEDGISNAILGFIGNMPIDFADMATTLTENFVNPWQTAADDVLDKLFGPTDSVKSAILNFFTGQEEGSLSAFLQTGVDLFSALPGDVGAVLSSFGLVLWEMFAMPIVRLFNWVNDRINDFLTQTDSVLSGVSDLLSGIGVQTDLGVSTITRLSEEPPGFLTPGVTEMFRGGLGMGPGMFSFGERGKEYGYVGPGQAVSVMNNNMTTSIDRLNNTLVDAIEAPMPAGASSAGAGPTDNRQQTYNFPSTDTKEAVRLAIMAKLFS